MCVRQACCAACSGAASKHGGQCGVWFYNGESKVCYLKTSAGPDKVTKPSPLFAAGYGTARQPSPKMQHAQIEIPTEFGSLVAFCADVTERMCLCAPGPGGRDSWCAYTGTFQDPAHA